MPSPRSSNAARQRASASSSASSAAGSAYFFEWKPPQPSSIVSEPELADPVEPLREVVLEDARW